MADIPIYTSAAPITPGTPVMPGKGVLIACEVAGYVRLVLPNNTYFDAYVFPGTSELRGFAIKDVNAAGTTATARVAVLY